MPQNRYIVHNRPDESRYVLLDTGEDGAGSKEIGEESYVDVSAESGIQRVLFHTGVSEEYSGRGLASVLVHAVVDDVVAAGLAIVPVCPYVKAWLPKHPEYAEYVTPAHREHIEAVKAQEQA